MRGHDARSNWSSRPKENRIFGRDIPAEPFQSSCRVEEARPAIELGTRVRQLRLDARLWTQEELARRAGMTQPALSRLERGEGIPTITVLDRIASALHATLTVSITPTRKTTGGTASTDLLRCTG